MTGAAFAAGDAVLTGAGRHATAGVVVAVGGCDWDECPHGAECVTIRVPGICTTMNYAAASLTAAAAVVPAAAPAGPAPYIVATFPDDGLTELLAHRAPDALPPRQLRRPR